jgi:hypothetical protein
MTEEEEQALIEEKVSRPIDSLSSRAVYAVQVLQSIAPDCVGLWVR